jgi:hypothetical protein
MAASDDTVVKSYCTKCRGITKHIVIKEVERSLSPDNTPGMGIDYWGQAHQVVACRGCDERSFRCVTVCSEDLDPETGDLAESVVSYPGEPPASREDMLEVRPFPHLTKKPRRIYRETIEAYNNELYTLAAGGLRAIVEAICIDKAIADGPVEEKDKATGVARTTRRNNLQGKIFGMAEKGFLTQKQAEVLHEHRFMGNDALHELEMPDADSLKLAIDIIEHTLVTIYE